MRLFLLAVLISTMLFASNNALLTQYRLHGLYGLKKSLDYDLTSKSYWLGVLKDANTKFGYIQPGIDLLTCDKQRSQLQLNVKDNNNTFVKKSDYQAIVGKNIGDKLLKGDLKTPVGIYTITKKINKIESFYGPMAFVTSYPNLYDKYRGRDGYGIWIHGVPENGTRQPYTHGCIALQNNNLEQLNNQIDYNKTLVIISNNAIKTRISKETLAGLLSSFYMWRFAWIYNDIDTYLSFYSPSFHRDDGLGFKAFKQYKTKLFHGKGTTSIKFTNIIILPYPGTKNLYEIIAHEYYKTNHYKWQGIKKLIVTLKHNKMQIITAN